MGQQAQAIVYGVFLTPEQRSLLQDEYDEWREWPDEVGRVETGSNGNVLGFALAVSNGADEDEASFPTCALKKVPDLLGNTISETHCRWEDLKKWALKHGAKLGRPRLLLVEVERA